MKKIYIIIFFLAFSSICAGETKYGGTLRLTTISDPKTFNIIIAQETSTTEAVGLLFEGLTRINGVTTEPQPCLATTWEHTKDGMEWIFNLREGVKWFDGKDFTSDDVVFTYNQLIYNKDIPSSSRDIFTIEGKTFKIEKIDKYKIKITTPTPYAPLLHHLSQPILPKHILEESVNQGKFSEKWGINTPLNELIGTGPYKLIEFLPSQRLVYERNPNYWRKDSQENSLPYIERIVTYIVQNIDAQLLKFRAGEIDVISVQGKDYALIKYSAPHKEGRSILLREELLALATPCVDALSSPEQAPGYSRAVIKSEEKSKNYTVYDCGPAFGTNFIAFNLNAKPWFSDLRFRQAVAYAVDRESMINNVLSGMGTLQHAAMEEPAKFFYNPNVKKYEYNPRKAMELLKEAGFVDSDNDGILEKPAGTPVKFVLLTNAENNQRVDIGTIIQADLKAIGLSVSFRPIDFNNLVTKLDYTHDWDCVLIGFTGGIEPHSGKNVWAIGGHLHIWNMPAVNISEWEKEIDDLFNKGVQELDPEKRRQIYWKWQEIVSENLPLIYTINSKAIYAVRNNIKNIHPTAYGGALHNIEEVWLEKK